MTAHVTVPFSDLARQTSRVTAMLADGDVILNRRDAADLYLSTVERHNRQTRSLQVTTRALAALATVRPDLAGDALSEALPWMAWLPIDEKVACLEELIQDLRAGVETGELQRFFLSMSAWQSTAVAWANPDLQRALQHDDGLGGASGSTEPPDRPSTEVLRVD